MLKAELAELRRGSTAQLRALLACVSSNRRARFALVVGVLVVAAASYAAQISVTYTFSNGAIAGEVNANFSKLVTESNDQELWLPALEADMATVSGEAAANTSAIAANSFAIVINTTDSATLMVRCLPCATQVGNEGRSEGCNVNGWSGCGSTEGVGWCGDAESCRGQILNVGTGTGNSVMEVIRAAESVTGMAVPPEIVARRPADPLRADGQLRQGPGELGWQPRYVDLKDIVAPAWKCQESYPGGYPEHEVVS